MFKKYNKRDVEVEMNIQRKLCIFLVPDFVWEEYHLDQEVNDRGIALDMDLVNNAVRFDDLTKIQLQNLPQNHIPDLMEARELVKSNDFEIMSMLYDN